MREVSQVNSESGHWFREDIAWDSYFIGGIFAYCGE